MDMDGVSVHPRFRRPAAPKQGIGPMIKKARFDRKRSETGGELNPRRKKIRVAGSFNPPPLKTFCYSREDLLCLRFTQTPGPRILATCKGINSELGRRKFGFVNKRTKKLVFVDNDWYFDQLNRSRRLHGLESGSVLVQAFPFRHHKISRWERQKYTTSLKAREHHQAWPKTGDEGTQDFNKSVGTPELETEIMDHHVHGKEQQGELANQGVQMNKEDLNLEDSPEEEEESDGDIVVGSEYEDEMDIEAVLAQGQMPGNLQHPPSSVESIAVQQGRPENNSDQHAGIPDGIANGSFAANGLEVAVLDGTGFTAVGLKNHGPPQSNPDNSSSAREGTSSTPYGSNPRGSRNSSPSPASKSQLKAGYCTMRLHFRDSTTNIDPGGSRNASAHSSVIHNQHIMSGELKDVYAWISHYDSGSKVEQTKKVEIGPNQSPPHQ